MTLRAVLRVIRVECGASGGTDGELLRRFADAGDQAAFATVFDRHAGMVLGVCRRVLTDPRDAEDACQATFLILARKARAVRWHASVANWLHATARKVARNVRVAAERRARREAAAAVPEAVPAADRMTARELLEALDEELARLPGRYREPLVLCYLEGLTRDQAARRLGVRPGTVKIWLERGLRRLAEALTARGTTPGAVLLAAAVTPALSSAVPRLTESTLAAVGGRPTAEVAAIADGVVATGTRLGVAWLSVGVVVLAVGLLIGSVAGRAPSPDTPKKTEAAPTAAAPTDAFGDLLPPGAVARLGSVRFRLGMWPRFVVPSPDGSKLATFGANGQHIDSLTVWDPAGRPVRTVSLAGAKVQSAHWLPDGRGFAVLKLDRTQYAVWEFTDEKAAPPAVIDLSGVMTTMNGTFVAATVSPDGKLVAGASQAGDEGTAGRVEVWPLVANGKFRPAAPRLTIDTPDGFVWLGFTPDSKRLIGVTRQREPNRPGVAAGPGQPIPLIPGAMAEKAKAFVWDAATGKEVRTFETPGGSLRAYAISPDGGTLYAASNKGRVAAFDLATGKERYAVDAVPSAKDEPWRYVSDLVVTGDGRTLLMVENMQAVAALDAVTGKSQWRHTDRDAKQVYALAAMPDGKRFVLGCVDGRLVVRDIATGKVTDPTPEYRGWFDAVALDEAGRVAVTSGRDGAFRRWDLASGRELGKIELAGFTGFSALAFSPDRRAVVGSGWEGDKAAVVVADATTGRTVTRVKGDSGHLFSATVYGGRPAAWLPDGSVLLADADCAVRFGPDGKVIRTYKAEGLGEGADAHAVAVSPDGRRAALAGHGPRGGTTTPGGWVVVFDAATGKLLRMAETSNWLVGAAFTPDGESVIVSGSVYPPSRRLGEPAIGESTTAAVALFDLADGKIRYPFADPTDGTAFRSARVLTVAPNSYQFAVVEHDNSITVYERASGAIRHRLRGHVNQIFQLAFTPDGSRLVSVSWDGTGLVWDVGPPKPVTAPATTDTDRLKRWEGLLAADGVAAHRVTGELAADPAGTFALLKANLKPTTVTDAEIDKLIEGLGAEAFADREAAAGALDLLGAAGVPRVKTRLAGVESAEVRRRLGEFLTKHDRTDKLTGVRLRERRAVELLEAVGTADALALLDELARPVSTALARDAAAAAGRLRAK